MADKLMYIPNDDTKIIPSLDIKLNELSIHILIKVPKVVIRKE